MIEYFAKHNIHLENVEENYGDIDEYILAARIYLQDENFDLLKDMIKDLDFEMAKDAIKGLYILALELRFLDLYQVLVEAYECLYEECYKELDEAVELIGQKRMALKEIFNV